ncbi:MAG: hypothetical protein ACRDBO_10020 [Lachnospiraceae bacterium]
MMRFCNGIGLVLLTATLILSGCSAIGGKKNEEIFKYLNSRYGSEEFQIEVVGEGENVSYKVSPNDNPELVFTVEKGKIDESQDWQYHDDYAARVLYDGAERRGLSYEKSGDEYNTFIIYKDYNSLDEVARQVMDLVAECTERKVFDKMRSACLLTIKPEEPADPLYPGYKIRIKTRYSFAEIQEFGVEAEDLTLDALTEELKFYHIYHAYNWSIPQDSDQYSPEIVDRYLEMCTGSMGKADDGSITVYDYVDKKSGGFSFGNAYQIFNTEGLVTGVEEDRFTASGNGMTVMIYRVIDEDEAKAEFEILEGEELFDARIGDEIYDVLTLLTDKSFEYTTPEKMARNDEAERLNRLPMIEEAYETAVSLGAVAVISDVEFTLMEMETTQTLTGSYNSMAAGQDRIWICTKLSIRNTGQKERSLFPWMVASSESITAIISDPEANLFQAVDVVNLGTNDLYGKTVAPGESIEGYIYFRVPKETVESGNLILLGNCEQDMVAVNLPD